MMPPALAGAFSSSFDSDASGFSAKTRKTNYVREHKHHVCPQPLIFPKVLKSDSTVLPLLSYVSLGKLLYLSEPPFFSCKM